MPTSSEKSTAVSVSARVSMLGCHSPCRPMKKNPAEASSPTRQLPSAHETKPTSATTPSQPMIGSGRSKTGWDSSDCRHVATVLMTRRISLKK